MGVEGLWPLLLENEYKAAVHYLTLLCSDYNPSRPSTIRIDVLGTFFCTIRRAYSRHPTDSAHAIVERELRKYGDPSTYSLVLYLDGHDCQEKKLTHMKRESARIKALQEAQVQLEDLEQRVKGKIRVRKKLFFNIAKQLRTAFRWSIEARKSFATYMRNKGWSIQECPFEADVAIANDCLPGDVVVSRDSDMLAYKTISILWRPISSGRVLVYDVKEVLDALEMTRTQLTALCVVSRNDYNNNSTSLACSTNYEIIKELEEDDVETAVAKYLTNSKVVIKGAVSESFKNSIEVFVRGKQSKCTDTSSQTITHAPTTIKVLLGKFDCIRKQMDENKNQLRRRQDVNSNGQVSHMASDSINIYRTVDRPPEQWPHAHAPGRGYKYRKRYSFKTRSRVINHPPPEKFKRYKWKAWNEKPESLIDSVAKQTPKKPSPQLGVKPNVAIMEKKDLVKAMQWEHPLRTLGVGTLNANTKQALSSNPLLQRTVRTSIQQVVRLSSTTKRICQRVIAQYIERVVNVEVDSKDRDLLDLICPRISNRSKDMEPDELEEVDHSDDETKDHQTGFLSSLMQCIYNGSLPRRQRPTQMDLHVREFFTRAKDFAPTMSGGRTVPYPASTILRSATSQLCVEIRKHYRNGSYELCEKIQALKKKNALPPDARSYIDENISAIENFVILNKTCGNRRVLAPLSSLEDGFITLSENDLITIFWKDKGLKELLQGYAHPTFPSIEKQEIAKMDVLTWLSNEDPGSIITKLVTSIGGLSSEQRKKCKGFKAKSFMMTVPEMRDHLQVVRHDNFNPSTYKKPGYALRGSIRTDGFLLQLLAFKINELNAVKYRRLPPDKQPCRLTTTVGGTDYFLTEIRNVVKTEQDIRNLWKCEPGEAEDIKILGLDLGQAYVVGASALLPTSRKPEATVAGPGTAIHHSSTKDPNSVTEKPKPKFRNLAVNQKAVYQPTFKLRRWIERRKSRPINDSESTGSPRSVSDIESSLPPIRGNGASVQGYVKQLQSVEPLLQDFYSGNQVIKKHRWNARRARDEEYKRIAESLLRMVGGSVGRKKMDKDKVVIAVGLGKFSSRIRLSSLDQSFQTYFIQLARSLDYIVVGINEYYTSKKCPDCEEFVGQVEIRRLYCPKCRTYFHRDVMAAHNICNIAKSHLTMQGRPLYLQPVDSNGAYPWMKDTSKEDKCEGLPQREDGGQCSRTVSQETPTDRKPRVRARGVKREAPEEEPRDAKKSRQ